jgi:triphosphoribosyl-dephospho-CoA synthase
VGEAVLAAVERVREELETNTNLGMVLLLAPLAAIPPDTGCDEGISAVLASLDLSQTRKIYRAIRLAAPGGLGQTDQEDVAAEPTVNIVAAMALASDRDLVARQYANQFHDVLGFGRSTLLQKLTTLPDWETAIIGTQLELLARNPDSLIQRKCGLEVAQESQQRARRILNDGWPLAPSSADELANFDRWLRADGHRRNPGTTADLIAAILFAAIRDGNWTPPAAIDITR